jgi:hypothetical protein
MSDLQSMHTQARKLILMLSAGVERLESAEQVTTYSANYDSALAQYILHLVETHIYIAILLNNKNNIIYKLFPAVFSRSCSRRLCH